MSGYKLTHKVVKKQCAKIDTLRIVSRACVRGGHLKVNNNP